MSVYLTAIKKFEYNLLASLNMLTNNCLIKTAVLGLTHLGGLTAPLIIVVFLTLNPDTGTVALILATAHFCTNIPVQLIKIKVARPRPYQVYNNIFNKGPNLSDYSFPSGHTTSAFTTATVLSHFLPELSLGFYCLAVIVGFTRMVLGVHYPTDVLIGSIIGTLIPLTLLMIIS